MIQLGVIGGHHASARHLEWARRTGEFIAKYPAVLVSGGLGGVMEAASRGAREAGGTVVGILPGESPETANPHVSVAIPTGMGYARNIIVVRSSALVFALDGGEGTLSEIAYAIQLKVPVIGLETWPIKGIHEAKDPDEAFSIARDLLAGVKWRQ